MKKHQLQPIIRAHAGNVRPFMVIFVALVLSGGSPSASADTYNFYFAKANALAANESAPAVQENSTGGEATPLPPDKAPVAPSSSHPSKTGAIAEEASAAHEQKASSDPSGRMGMGVDLGDAGFTGGLGSTTSPGWYLGARYEYFLSAAIAIEGSVHYSHHTDNVGGANISTSLIPIALAVRYYPFQQSDSAIVRFLNPYVAGGGGLYVRTEHVLSNGGLIFANSSSTTKSLGLQGGLGAEVNVYNRALFLGVDARYHYIFFDDRGSTFNGMVPAGSRSGAYYTVSATLTYCL